MTNEQINPNFINIQIPNFGHCIIKQHRAAFFVHANCNEQKLSYFYHLNLLIYET